MTPSATAMRASRISNPFTDATNRVGFDTKFDNPKERPVSRRAARKLNKQLKKAQNDQMIDNALTCAEEPMPPTKVAAQTDSAPKNGIAWRPGTLPLVYPPRDFLTRRYPVLIIRTIPAPPPPRFHGPFEACEREDFFFDEPELTWEEDAWGVSYPPGEWACSVVGPIRVVTHVTEHGSQPSAQFYYISPP